MAAARYFNKPLFISSEELLRIQCIETSDELDEFYICGEQTDIRLMEILSSTHVDLSTGVLFVDFWRSLDFLGLQHTFVPNGVLVYDTSYFQDCLYGSATADVHQELISFEQEYTLLMEEQCFPRNVLVEASDKAQDWISQEMVKPHVRVMKEKLQFTDVQIRNGLEILRERAEEITFVSLLNTLVPIENAVLNHYVGTGKYAFSADVKLVLRNCYDVYNGEPTQEQFEREWNRIKGTGIEHLMEQVEIEKEEKQEALNREVILQEEKRRAEEEKRRAEEEKLEALNREAVLEEEKQEALNRELILQEEKRRAEEEKRRAEEEKRRAEEEKLEALNREAVLEEEKQKALNRELILQEEKRRAEEEKRRAEEEKRRAEEEKRRAEEEKRRAEEEKLEALNREAVLEEEKQKALNRELILQEEKRRAEEEKRRAEEEKRRAEEEKLEAMRDYNNAIEVRNEAVDEIIQGLNREEVLKEEKEAERVKAEVERVKAEAERVKAEAERVKAEAERVKAEAERVKADRLEKEKEVERVKADMLEKELAKMTALFEKEKKQLLLQMQQMTGCVRA